MVRYGGEGGTVTLTCDGVCEMEEGESRLQDFKTERLKMDKQQLELDGYNEELRMAFEYQGDQHYHFNNFFHKGQVELFDKQKLVDEFKVIKCAEEGVQLYIIPYWIKKTKVL
jgi:hypothetical protein